VRLAIRPRFFHARLRFVAMDNRDRNAPDNDRDTPLGDPPSSRRIAAARPAVDAPAVSAESPATEAMRTALRAYVSRPQNIAAMRRKIARKVPADDVDDVLQNAAEKAVSGGVCPPTSEDGIPGWVGTVVRRAIARYHRHKQAREQREGLTDTIDEHADPSTEVGWSVDGWMIPWLEKEVAGDDRDEELFDMLLEKTRTGMTYEELATKHGMTIAALTSRLFRFKKKYGPRYERAKRNAILLLLLGGVSAIALALVVWLLLGRLFRTEPPHGAVPSASPAFVPVPPPHDPATDVAHPPPKP
jgi:DNA-directed RNA polymerase specialized sigma24 family protein